MQLLHICDIPKTFPSSINKPYNTQSNCKILWLYSSYCLFALVNYSCSFKTILKTIKSELWTSYFIMYRNKTRSNNRTHTNSPSQYELKFYPFSSIFEKMNLRCFVPFCGQHNKNEVWTSRIACAWWFLLFDCIIWFQYLILFRICRSPSFMYSTATLSIHAMRYEYKSVAVDKSDYTKMNHEKYLKKNGMRIFASTNMLHRHRFFSIRTEQMHLRHCYSQQHNYDSETRAKSDGISFDDAVIFVRCVSAANVMSE